MRRKIAFKVLMILGVSLSFGLIGMVAISIWQQTAAISKLQLKNARNLTAVFMDGIDEYMMKGDSKEVDRYIRESKEKKYFLDLKIYDEKGKESGAKGGSEPNPNVAQVLQDGKTVEFTSNENGVHTLNIVSAMPNSDKCKQCHDKEPKYLGGIHLKTSIQYLSVSQKSHHQPDS